MPGTAQGSHAALHVSSRSKQRRRLRDSPFVVAVPPPSQVFDASKHTPAYSHTHQCMLAFLIERFSEGMPEGIAEYTTVFDLRAFTRKNTDFKNLLAGIKTVQIGYPERMYRLVCFLAPRLAFCVYRLIAPFMDKRLRSKVRVWSCSCCVRADWSVRQGRDTMHAPQRSA